jgi:hypothetical protein
MPQALVSAFVFGSIVYWATGLQPAMIQFLVFMAVCLTLVLTSQALGLIIGAAIDSVMFY